MAWDTDFPLVALAQKLVDTRLRTERLRMAQRLHSLETRAAIQGLPTQPLKALRQSLQQATLSSADRVDRSLVLLSKPVGVWRRKYLSVQTKPGSVF